MGLPGWKFIESTDPVELLVLGELMNEAIKRWDKRTDQVAIRTANAVGKMLSGK